jgi:DNA-binding transcriptional LysR family regulator
MIMSLSASHLDAFFMVTQALNFTKAADKLNITQSALSQRILNLESELGTTLFIRDRAGLKLTETAVRLLRFCQMKKSLEEEFLNQIKSNNPKELAGNLNIGGFSSVTASILIPLLAGFLKKHPNINLSVFAKEADDLISMMKRGEIDFMILDDRLQKEELERVSLGQELNVLVECRDYEGSDVYLDHDENDMTTYNYLRKFKHNSKNIKRIYLDDIHGLMVGVRSGLGQAVLPLHMVKNDKSLIIVNPKDILEIPVYLYYFYQPYYSQLHQAVIQELTNKFKDLLTATERG